MSPDEPGDLHSDAVSKERSAIERVLHAVDGMRGLIGSLLIGAIGVAAIRAGGTAGWALGAALSLVCVLGVTVVARGHG
jgi:hypothetical protein